MAQNWGEKKDYVKELDSRPDPPYTAEQRRLIDFIERYLKEAGDNIQGKHRYVFETADRGWIVGVYSAYNHGFRFHVISERGQLRVVGPIIVNQ